MSASERRFITQEKARRLSVAAHFSWINVKSAAEQRESRYCVLTLLSVTESLIT